MRERKSGGRRGENEKLLDIMIPNEDFNIIVSFY